MAATATAPAKPGAKGAQAPVRSEEHTSELQSHLNIVCRLLLEKKKELSKASSTVDDRTANDTNPTSTSPTATHILTSRSDTHSVCSCATRHTIQTIAGTSPQKS